jgi:hypothetical protein
LHAVQRVLPQPKGLDSCLVDEGPSRLIGKISVGLKALDFFDLIFFFPADRADWLEG